MLYAFIQYRREFIEIKRVGLFSGVGSLTSEDDVDRVWIKIETTVPVVILAVVSVVRDFEATLSLNRPKVSRWWRGF
jgi:hypothetical protein